MSEAAIRAGKAWVAVGLKDEVQDGLDKIEKRFLSWGLRLGAVGGIIQGAGASILAALGLAANSFADTGSEIFEMTQKTGASAVQLSELSFAARQSGADLSSLGVAMKSMGKFTLALTKGSKSSVEALDALGISKDAFLAGDPVKRMGLIADGLLRIEDPGLKAALAMQVLGKAGEGLLPMLAEGSKGLEAMTAQAREFNLTWTDEEVQKADALGDAWDLLNDVWQRIVTKTGGALADVLTLVFQGVARVGAATIEFIDQNQFLVLGLAAAAVAAVILGGAILGLATASLVLAGIMYGLNAAIAIAASLWAALGVVKTTLAAINTLLATTLTAEGIAAAFAAVQTFLLAVATNILTLSVVGLEAALAALVSPLGLILLALTFVVLGVAAAVVAFVQLTEAGQQLASDVGAGFLAMWTMVSTTLKGIFDAIMSGNWKLAGEVLMAGLTVAMQVGINSLKVHWEDFKLWLITLFADLTVGIVEATAAGLKNLIGLVNMAREKIGLEAIGTSGIDGMVGTAQSISGGIKGAAQGSRDAAVAEADRNLQAAVGRLMEVTKRAADERAAKDADRKSRMGSLFDGLLDASALSLASGNGSASGTFNAAVASMIGQTAESAADKTAANTGAMKEHLAAVRQKIEEGLFEVGE